MPPQKRLDELRAFSLDDEANQAKTVTDLKNKRKDVQEKRMACEIEKLLKDEKKGGRKRRLEQDGVEGSSKMSKRCFLPTESSDKDDLVSKSELEKMKTECDKANRKLKLKHKEIIQLKKKNDRLQELNVRLQDQLLSLLRSTTQQHTNRSLLDISPQTEEHSKKEKNANEGLNLMSVVVEESNSSPTLTAKVADIQNVQSKDEEKQNMDPFAILSAVEEGDLRRMRQLIEAGASVDSRDNKGRTPLLLGAAWGHHAVVEFLINYKLDPKNHAPSMLQGIGVESEGAIGLFLEHDDENYTLLHFASAEGWTDIAQTIIEKGSQSDIVNAATKSGVTPLLMAAMHGQEDVAALLLRSGADVNARDIDGKTALHWAALEGHAGMVKLLLQEKGLDLNPQDEEGRTPLHVACFWRNNVEVIQQLLVAGVDVNLNNRNGDTPLSIYLNVINPSLEVINLFVQRGAFFQDRDYSIILRCPVLGGNVLKNVDLCTQSVINKFSYHTLPALFSSPYFASILPPMDNFMLSTSQKDELKISVRSDIQQNMLCNVVRVRPTALSALCIQCLAAYITSRK